MSTALSYSRVNVFLECPKQYEFRRNHVPQSSLPEYMVTGKFAHRFYMDYVLHCIATDSRQNLQVLDVIKKTSYQNALHESVEAKEPSLDISQWSDVFERLCRPWAMRTALPIDKIVDVECKWAITKDGTRCDFDSDEAWWRGVVDRLESLGDDNYRVVDYKTGWSSKADEFQAKVYAWYYLAAGAKSVQVVFEFTALDRTTTHTYTADDFNALDEEIDIITDGILSCEEFHPRPGCACLDCPYGYCCQAKADVTQLEVISSQRDAYAAIQAIALLERDLKGLKQALRTWCDKNGPVSHNGITWAHWQYDGEGFHDVKAFVEACKANGIPAQDYLTVNNVRAKKLRKVIPEALSMKPTEKFLGKRQGEEDE